MGIFSWRKHRIIDKKNQQQSFRELQKRWRKLFVWPLESRIAPSADTLVPGLTGTLTNNFDTASGKFLSVITSTDPSSLFSTPIPGVLQTNHDITGNGKFEDNDVHVPVVRDALALTVDQNQDGVIPGVPGGSLAARYSFIQGLGIFDFQRVEKALNAIDTDGDHLAEAQEFYRVLVIGGITDFLTNYDATSKTVADLQADYTTFLSGLSAPDSLDGSGLISSDLMRLSLTSVANNSTASLFSHNFTVNLTVKNQYLIDLGHDADKFEVVLPDRQFVGGTTNYSAISTATRQVELDGSMILPFTVALDISSPPVDNGDFSFFVRSRINVAVNDIVAGPGGESLQDTIVNVGFLGTQGRIFFRLTNLPPHHFRLLVR